MLARNHRQTAIFAARLQQRAVARVSAPQRNRKLGNEIQVYVLLLGEHGTWPSLSACTFRERCQVGDSGGARLGGVRRPAGSDVRKRIETTCAVCSTGFKLQRRITLATRCSTRNSSF